eukprot:14058988-Alexandrium_andersonii.AAC.1
MRPRSRSAYLRGGSTHHPLMPRNLLQPADEKVGWLRPWIAEDCGPDLMAAFRLIHNSVLVQRANPGFRHTARASISAGYPQPGHLGGY